MQFNSLGDLENWRLGKKHKGSGRLKDETKKKVPEYNLSRLSTIYFGGGWRYFDSQHMRQS